MTAPPEHTMQSLLNLLTDSPTITPSQIKQLLIDHKAQLLSHIYSTPQSTQPEIRYRTCLKSTEAYPKPTPAETRWLAQYKLPLPKHLAALHLRDYLHDAYPTNTSRLLQAASLISFVSPKAVLQFSQDEMRAAFSVLTHVLTCSDQDSISQFLISEHDNVRDTIIKAVTSIISPPSGSPSDKGVDPSTILSLLLTSTITKFLALDDILPIIKIYITVTSSSDPFTLPAFQKEPLSIYLLTTAITTAIRQHPIPHSLIDPFRPLLSQKSTLPALVSLSLASVLRGKDANTPDSAVSQQDPSQEFMTHAVSSDALGKLRVLLHEPYDGTDPRSVKSMFHVIVEDLLFFLSAFPPCSLERSQIEDLSLLVSGLMAKSDAEHLVNIANSLWDEGEKPSAAKGVESILHLSSAIYPLSFRPLIALLRVLAVDKRSAAHSINYLEHKMMIMCENAEGYADAIIALDEDEDIVWDKLGDREHEYRAAKTLADVRMGGSMVFVQAMREIPGGTYRGNLPAGAMGVCDHNFTTVAWVAPWNGFGAIVYAFDTLHDILCNNVPPSPELRAVLEDLVDSAIGGLRFVEQICLHGSATLRYHVGGTFGTVETIARIVAEILSMKGKSSFSEDSLQTLLKAASSCLPILAGENVEFANRIAIILCPVVKEENFNATLSSFGVIASAVLAALAAVCSTLLFETRQGKVSDMMVSVGSDERVVAYSKGITDLLCSASLGSSNFMTSLDREPTAKWLMVAWSMRLFQSSPKVLLCSFPAAALFAATVLYAASGSPLSESDSLLYPTACEAMIACLKALQSRSRQLGNGSHGTAMRRTCSQEPEKAHQLTALEQVLLRSDVVEAMVVICCGGAKRLRDERFYTTWLDSEERNLLPVRETTTDCRPYDRLLAYGVPDTSIYERTRDSWIAGISSSCLSLQMDCLSHIDWKQDAPQVPWPSSSSSLNAYACKGAEVRGKIAKRISEGQGTELLGLLVAVLSCRQRAASRSLFGPRQSSPDHSVTRSSSKTDPPEKTDKKYSAKQSKDNDQRANPIQAVLSCLKCAFQSCKKILADGAKVGGSETLNFLKRVGHLSTIIATCVRILRLGLASQNGRWFRDHVESEVWELLASLVRCGAANDGSRSFDLKRTTQDWYACSTVSDLSKISELGSHRDLVLNAEHILDIASIWKGIAADVLRLFSREVLAEATDALLTTRKNTSDNDYSLQEKVFRAPLFLSFANVFSETWVTVLLGTEPVHETMHRPGLTTESQKAKRLRAAPTLNQLVQRLSTRITEATSATSSDSELLSEFDRSGDLAVPYGASYAFDITNLRQFLASKDISDALSGDLILAVMDLNVTIGRQDVYLEVLSSFSSMASIVLFIDSLCPTRALELSYSSPQFGGKLCRYLPRVMTRLLPGKALSWHFVAVSLEVSRLLSILSVRLTKEELEQSALTSMRTGEDLDISAELRHSSPLGHICYTVNHVTSTETSGVWIPDEPRSRQQILSWLLLTASRYTNGSAFRTTEDLQSLVRSCVRILKMVNKTSETCTAVSTALTETFANMPDDVFLATLSKGVSRAILSAVDAVANMSNSSDSRSQGKAIAELLLTLTSAIVRLQNVGNNEALLSLRDITASGVQPLLPKKGMPLETYNLEFDERSISHTLWCSVLQLAAVVIRSREQHNESNAIQNDDTPHVVEFCSMHLERIVEDSLDLQNCRGESAISSSSDAGLKFQAVSLAKVEEAELGAIFLSRLSPYGLVLQNVMPTTVRQAVAQLCRYTAQAIRILRTNPVEKWVRPVTMRERERSGVAMEQLISVVGSHSIGHSTPNSSPSPRRRSKSQLTPKRSPSQALRAALTGRPRQGLTPSPGSSLTPLMSPMPAVKDIQGTPPYFSPNSPWGQHGSGLITRTGQCFAEEVTMSLLRGLCAALNGIRELSEHLNVYPFQPTMETTGDAPGIGTLLDILKFACWELNREGDDDRRSCAQGVADAAMHLTLSNAMTHAERGELPRSVRDEVRKRVTTTLYRANNLVPPIPSSSILRDDGLMSLWKQF